MKRLFIRAETKAGERRVAIVPQDAKALIDQEIEVWVERSPLRSFRDEEYAEVGCSLLTAGAWKTLSPNQSAETLILGLKELETTAEPISGIHTYFGHLFKGQKNARAVLDHFSRGAGLLYDLEYLVDANQRRIAAFGFWAGYVGAALGLLAWIEKKSKGQLCSLTAWSSREELISTINQRGFDCSPSIVITGSKGRCGAGATQLLRDCGLIQNASLWDLQETKLGGPFSELHSFDILIHAVGNQKIIAPFLTANGFDSKPSERRSSLEVVVDVTCDLGNPTHLLPFIQSSTDLEVPVKEMMFQSRSLHVIAIDHLPTLLPRESSQDFSRQLLPHLLGFFQRERKSVEIFGRALALFEQQRMEQIK